MQAATAWLARQGFPLVLSSSSCRAVSESEFRRPRRAPSRSALNAEGKRQTGKAAGPIPSSTKKMRNLCQIGIGLCESRYRRAVLQLSGPREELAEQDLRDAARLMRCVAC